MFFQKKYFFIYYINIFRFRGKKECNVLQGNVSNFSKPRLYITALLLASIGVELYDKQKGIHFVRDEC